MNERAREVLVAAALKGVRQIRGEFREGDGRCAIGVLEDALGVACTTPQFGAHYGIRPGDLNQIAEANDTLGWDFLTIARKIGTTESGEVLGAAGDAA